MIPIVNRRMEALIFLMSSYWKYSPSSYLQKGLNDEMKIYKKKYIFGSCIIAL